VTREPWESGVRMLPEPAIDTSWRREVDALLAVYGDPRPVRVKRIPWRRITPSAPKPAKPAKVTLDCPCGCGNPVRGHKYATVQCGKRMWNRKHRPAPETRREYWRQWYRDNRAAGSRKSQ